MKKFFIYSSLALALAFGVIYLLSRERNDDTVKSDREAYTVHTYGDQGKDGKEVTATNLVGTQFVARAIPAIPATPAVTNGVLSTSDATIEQVQAVVVQLQKTLPLMSDTLISPACVLQPALVTYNNSSKDAVAQKVLTTEATKAGVIVTNFPQLVQLLNTQTATCAAIQAQSTATNNQINNLHKQLAATITALQTQTFTASITPIMQVKGKQSGTIFTTNFSAINPGDAANPLVPYGPAQVVLKDWNAVVKTQTPPQQLTACAAIFTKNTVPIAGFCSLKYGTQLMSSYDISGALNALYPGINLAATTTAQATAACNLYCGPILP